MTMWNFWSLAIKSSWVLSCSLRCCAPREASCHVARTLDSTSQSSKWQETDISCWEAMALDEWAFWQKALPGPGGMPPVITASASALTISSKAALNHRLPCKSRDFLPCRDVRRNKCLLLLMSVLKLFAIKQKKKKKPNVISTLVLPGVDILSSWIWGCLFLKPSHKSTQAAPQIPF